MKKFHGPENNDEEQNHPAPKTRTEKAGERVALSRLADDGCPNCGDVDDTEQ